jgi:endonuclease/exonuclease/phosphatase family metal-dependent hydrolase
MKTLALLPIVFACLVSNAMGEQFRIATYNLNWANQRGDQVLDAISTAKPDLICFQETTLQSERFLRDRLSAEFPHFVSVGHQGRYAAERFAFASKLPLAEVEFTPPDAGLFGFCAATVRIGGEAIRIVNVHLTPVVLKQGDRFAAVMDALSDAEAKHKVEITAVTKGLDLDKPTIVLGDFNSISSFIAPKTLADMGMVDSFTSVVANPDTHATWTWPTRPLPISLRIDYIFHTKHFSTKESEIIRREGSDHSLVVSELLLKPAEVSSTRSE